MGADLSRLAGDAAAAAGGGKGRHDKPKTILCPPLFERDLKARSRWAKSSYDFNFSKPALRWLLGDFFDGGLNAVLFFAPPIDERISVKAKLGNSAAVIFGGSGSGGAGGGGGNSSSSSSSIAAAKTDVGGRPGGYGNVTVRYQPLGPHVPSTFFDVKANPRVAGDVAVRACFFSPESGLGVFASAPLSQGGGATGRQPEVGVRYSSPDFAAGSVVRPGTGEVSGMWMAGRLGDVTAGWQLRPCRGPSAAFSRAPLDFGGGGGGAGGSAASALPALSSPSAGPDLLRWLRDRSSVALAYSPRAAGADGRPSPEAHTRAGQPAFCAAVELVEGRAFCLSFFQHAAAVRRVFNPFEGSGVVGIASSIDVGLRLAMPLSAESGSGGGGGGGASSSSSSPPAAAAGLELGAAWQPNKNTYAKVKIDSGAVSVMAALKSWYQPSAAVAATAEWRFGGGVRFGVFGQVENFGALRYERPRDAAAAAHGATLTQRHEATPAELALAAREKPLVPGDEAFGARNVEPATQLYM